MITVVCLTKDRSFWLKEYVASLVYNCRGVNTFEIVFLVNENDTKSINEVHKIHDIYRAYKIKLWINPTFSMNLSEDYYNKAWREGVFHGDYVWVTGDDVRMLTEDWDVKMVSAIENRLHNHPDRVLYAFPKDVTDRHKPKLGNFTWGCFPILTREAIVALGWFFPKECPTWGADIALARIFNDPQVRRALPIEDIVVDHISYHTHSELVRDEVSLDVERHYNLPEVKANMQIYMRADIRRDIERVCDAISRMG